MTLEEAIKHCEDIAESCEWEAGLCGETDGYECHEMHELGKCASDHRQLVEWLRELKNYRVAIDNFERRTMSQCLTRDFCDGWNACYDDIIVKLSQRLRSDIMPNQIANEMVETIHQLEERLTVELDNSHCLEIELTEAKRLLKAAVKIIYGLPCNDDNCRECVHGDYVCDEYKNFKWCYADEAERLIEGEKVNEM